jgi:acyl carrier protein
MTLHQQLEELIRELLNRDDIVLTDETEPSEIPGWDSLVHINLMFGLEQQFGLRIDGNRILEFRNIRELKHYIQDRTTQPTWGLRAIR